jgi:CheY-like chemotaxis protein
VRLQFTVTDTGIGVSPEKQQRIFKPYDQGDPGIARRYGGTGLGLAVSSQLVRMMGGQIALSSRPGHGSAFGFTALFDCSSETRKARAMEPPPRLQVKSVLVVDDNAAACRIVVDILKRHRLSVRVAGSAEEARRAVQSEPHPELVLLDSGLPGIDGFACAARLRRELGFTGRLILMLTFTHLKRKSECAGLGVNATLLKPFGSRELLQALAKAEAARHSSTPAEFESIPSTHLPAKAHSLPLTTEGAARCLRILVAEDTPVNQKFILRLLERWGHTAVLVDDGSRAVAEVSRSEFDVVLMDVQMPEMDGLTAAAAIRRQEANSGRHTPIVAMTAHAIKGDRERCLSAGMDEYIAKPIDAKMLKQIIERLTVRPRSPEIADSPGEGLSSELLKAFENDWSFFGEVAEVFLSDYPRQLHLLRASAQSGDAAAFRRAAHSLKGMLQNFQAEGAAQMALQLETRGLAGELAGIEPLIEKLAEAIQVLAARLRELIVRSVPQAKIQT